MEANVSNCFKSFKEISGFNENKPILSILKESEKYFAHTSLNKAKETLEEHLKLVVSYFLKLVNSHHLDKVVDNLILESIPHNFGGKIRLGNLVKTAFYKTILYHDFGKVNHHFQWDKNKMDNPRSDLKIVNHKVGSQHSIISTYLFLMHELDNEHFGLNDYEQTYLDFIISGLSYPILKHHSKYLGSVMDTDFEGNEKYFQEYLELFNKELPKSLDLLHNIITDFETSHEQFSKLNTEHFSFFALLKLNYSLITVSDYYATGEYMQELEVKNFGLIENEFRKSIIQNFKTSKSFNKKLFDNPEDIRNISFESLQTKSNANLNVLRQKIAAEALINIRRSSCENLYYLEAPTGGGKTNASLAMAISLLESHKELNKIFYVFPFTTLVSQTAQTIKNSFGVSDEHIIELHSRSGFHQQNEEANDGNYGDQRLNFLNNHFVNYPITLLTHIKFFNIIKGNDKDSNYILHRLANAIVIIDELQSYNPKHWDKIIYFLANYARLLNMRIILMSATLPKIDNLLDGKSLERRNKVKYLINPKNKNKYFQNVNFAGRVEFDFSILDKYSWRRPKAKEERYSYLVYLMERVFIESENYANRNTLRERSVATIIEFITKKSASAFLQLLESNPKFKDYKIFLISGEILEPRRKYVISLIKSGNYNKVILVSTQVIEAGVDIDMDIGFKDRSLVDSDEQLAGRVNRNAEKKDSKVFIFDYDSTPFIYKGDRRLNVDPMFNNELYKEILRNKDFDSSFYQKVNSEIIKVNCNEAIKNLSDYKHLINRLDFLAINKEFKLIEQENESVFVPLLIPKEHFSGEDCRTLEYFQIPVRTIDFKNCVSGEDVWKKYISINASGRNGKTDYFRDQISLKQIYGLLSKFIFSAFSNQIEQLKEYTDFNEYNSSYKWYGVYYLSHWRNIYDYERGLDISKVEKGEIFL